MSSRKSTWRKPTRLGAAQDAKDKIPEAGEVSEQWMPDEWRKRRAEKLAKKNADRAGGKGNLTKKKRRR